MDAGLGNRIDTRLRAGIVAACAALLAGCGDGDSPAETAAVCFNPGAYEPGASLVAVYRPHDPATGRVNGPDAVRNTSVSGPVPFQAAQALDRFTVSGDYGYHLYFSLDGLVVVARGNRTVSGLFDDNQSTRTVAYAPPARTVLDFSLRVGETRTETLGVLVDGQPAGTIVSSITFAGFEDVTTPAGVFEGACRFVYPSTQEGVDTPVTVWFARGSGVEVRTLTTTLVAEPGNDGPRLTPVQEDLRLVLATLNGMLVSR